MGNGNRGLARPFNPGNVLANTSNNAGGFLMTSPPSKLGAIPKKMPSPAAQVHTTLHTRHIVGSFKFFAS